MQDANMIEASCLLRRSVLRIKKWHSCEKEFIKMITSLNLVRIMGLFVSAGVIWYPYLTSNIGQKTVS